MESLPEWANEYYDLYSEPFLPESASAKNRVSRTLPLIQRHLPKKGSKVLDLCCGAGAYLFPLEKAGYDVTGVDIQDRMIKLARRYAKKIKSRATVMIGDARSLRLKDGTFDAVVFLGAPFAHFSLPEFRQIASEAFRVLKHKGVMIAEVSDHVALLFSGMYQRTLYEPAGDIDVISIHTRYDQEKGTFNRIFLDLSTNRRFKGSFYIWTPWLADDIMQTAGFELKQSESSSSGTFSRLQTYAKS
ncbi:MAG: class I SAM-dependent methyltransferase [Nitrososphaerales archaeon]